MKRALSALLVLGLLVAGSMTAQAEVGIAPCADFDNGEGSYLWTGTEGQLSMSVTLGAAACSDVTYELWVVRDGGGDPSSEADVFDMAGPAETGQEELLSSSTGGSGTTLSYDLAVADNDPTICVFSVSSRPGATDENGNGTTVDDQHKSGSGNNRDGSKFVPDGATVIDRAPDTGCLELNFVWDSTVGSVRSIAGGGGQGYN